MKRSVKFSILVSIMALVSALALPAIADDPDPVLLTDLGAGPAAVEHCNHGAWELFEDPSFAHQGDCVTYVLTLDEGDDLDGTDGDGQTGNENESEGHEPGDHGKDGDNGHEPGEHGNSGDAEGGAPAGGDGNGHEPGDHGKDAENAHQPGDHGNGGKGQAGPGEAGPPPHANGRNDAGGGSDDRGTNRRVEVHWLDGKKQEAYFLTTGSGIVQEWRWTDGKQVVFKPAGAFDPGCDAGATVSLENWFNKAGKYTELDGDDADLVDFLPYNVRFHVCIYDWDGQA